MIGKGKRYSIENCIVSVCDILLCRDSNLLSSSKAMLRSFAAGLNSSSDSDLRTAVPLVGEAVFYPDTVAVALHEMCQERRKHTDVPIEAWYALAAAYNNEDRASKDVLVALVDEVVKNQPNTITVNLVSSSITLKVEDVSRKTHSKRMLNRNASSSRNDVHDVTFSEEGILQVLEGSTILSTLQVKVQYTVHLKRRVDDYRDVEVIPCMVTASNVIQNELEGSGAAENAHNFKEQFNHGKKKAYRVRVPLRNLEARLQDGNPGRLPSAPTMDNDIGLQKDISGYADKRLLREVTKGSDIAVRALSALSGIHASRFIIVGHRTVVEKTGNAQTYTVTDRVITRLRCEGNAIANVFVQINYTVRAADTNGTEAKLDTVNMSVIPPEQPVDGIRFLTGDVPPRGLHCKINATAVKTKSARDLFAYALWKHTETQVLAGQAIEYGITRMDEADVNTMLLNWKTSADDLLTSKGINEGLLATFISMVLRDQERRNVSVSVEKHMVAHRGIIVGASGSQSSATTSQHHVEEHFICKMSTTTEQVVPLHVCASYVVHDYKDTGSATGASLGKLHIGLRTVGGYKTYVQDIKNDIERRCLLNTDFVWFDASSHEVVDINCHEFAQEIGKIDVAAGTTSLLGGNSQFLYKVTNDNAADPIRCLITECLGPIVEKHAELLSGDIDTSYAELLGDPKSCMPHADADTRWLYRDDHVVVDCAKRGSNGDVYLIPHSRSGDSVETSKRKQLITKLSYELAHGTPLPMLEAIVNLAQQESTFRRFLREAVGIALLQVPCDVNVVDAALFIGQPRNVDNGNSGCVTVFQHLLLEPKAWWNLSPRKLHAVVGYAVGIAHGNDLKECLEFSNASVHFRYLDANVGSLDPYQHINCIGKNGAFDEDSFYYSMTKMLDEEVPKYRVPCADILAALQRLHGTDEYSYVMRSTIDTNAEADVSLEKKVKYCIEQFVSVHGANEVIDIENLPLTCVGAAPTSLGRNTIQIDDLSGHLLGKSGCQKIAAYLKAMLESSPDAGGHVKVTIDERGIINEGSRKTLEDPETLLGSLKTGMMICRSLLIKEERTAEPVATVHVLLICDVKTRSTGSSTAQLVISEVCFRVLTDKSLSPQFHESPAGFFGSFERYNEFVSSLRVILDLSAAHLVSTVAVGQGRARDKRAKSQAHGLLAQLNRKGRIMDDANGDSERMDGQDVQEQRRHAKNRADYFERRCASLLDITFKNSLPPSVDEVKRAMKFLVHVVSDGRITIAEIAALNRSSLRTNYSKVSDDAYCVTHEADVDTDNHGSLRVQFTYKASRVVDSASRTTSYILSNAELVVKGSNTQTLFDGQPSTTMRLSQNVGVPKEMWNSLVGRYNKLFDTKEKNSFKGKFWNCLKSVINAVYSCVKYVLRALFSCFCRFGTGSSVSEFTHGGSPESRSASSVICSGTSITSDRKNQVQGGTTAGWEPTGKMSGAPNTEFSEVSARSVYTSIIPSRSV